MPADVLFSPGEGSRPKMRDLSHLQQNCETNFSLFRSPGQAGLKRTKVPPTIVAGETIQSRARGQ